MCVRSHYECTICVCMYVYSLHVLAKDFSEYVRMCLLLFFLRYFLRFTRILYSFVLITTFSYFVFFSRDFYAVELVWSYVLNSCGVFCYVPYQLNECRVYNTLLSFFPSFRRSELTHQTNISLFFLLSTFQLRYWLVCLFYVCVFLWVTQLHCINCHGENLFDFGCVWMWVFVRPSLIF